MSAGDKTDHHIQDAAEAYLVWQLQLAIERSDLALVKSSERLKKAFDNYIDQRGVRSEFGRSEYKANVDLVVQELAAKLADHFLGLRLSFEDVEKDYRDRKLKGDLEIQLSKGSPVSVSVKNYKKGFRRIQLCSGTWNSFLNNFLFTADGVGMFIDPRDGSRFKGSDVERRNQIVIWLGLESLIEVYEFIDATNKKIRKFYIDEPAARFWADVEDRWKADCALYGNLASERLSSALDQVEPTAVKRRLLQMAGLSYEEELLLLGQGKYLCSLFSEPYRKLLKAANDDSTTVSYQARKQSLIFTIRDDQNRSLAEVQVPFTLQKNGAWHLPRSPYKGKQYHEKEGLELAYGERRPAKSRELATSTNTYLDLGAIGVT